MSRKPESRKISQLTEQKAGEYLFEKGDLSDSQFMDMRTRVRSESGMRTLLYLGVLHESMDCDEAGQIKDLMERLFVAYGGGGRAEAVEILRQNFPKKVEVEKGSEGLEDYTKKTITTE